MLCVVEATYTIVAYIIPYRLIDTVIWTYCDTIGAMFKQLLKLPLWAALLIALVVLIIISVTFSSLNPWNPLNYFGRPDTTVDISRDAVVRDIQALNRLETTSFTIEKIIEAGTDGNVFQDILYGDRLLLIAHGQVRAGVDLSRVSDADVQTSTDTLTITLPNTEIFSSQLDADKTKVYDRRQGILSRGDKDLETQARQSAERSIRQAACDAGIMAQSAKDAQEQLSQIYTLAGFERVEVRVQPGNCD